MLEIEGFHIPADWGRSGRKEKDTSLELWFRYCEVIEQTSYSSYYIKPNRSFASKQYLTNQASSQQFSVSIRMMNPHVKLGLQRHCMVG